jgi:hypothetical protein
MKKRPVLERIADKTDSSAGPDACWRWLGCHAGKGNPMVGGEDTRGGGKPVRRYLWEAQNGRPVPAGRAASVTCGNNRCVNPAHLTLVLYKASIADRLDQHIDKSGGADACWPWTDAASFHRGYGMFRTGWKRPLMPAHRAVYEVVHGITLTSDNVIMHSCDNPPCCNPAHLTLGTHMTNHHDMVAKGRAGWQKKRAAKALPLPKTGTTDT